MPEAAPEEDCPRGDEALEVAPDRRTLGPELVQPAALLR